MAERGGQVTTPAGEVDVVWDGPARAPAALVLGPGAGAGLDSDFMAAMAAGLAGRGLAVCRFNFPYLQKGRRSPDRPEVLEATFGAVAAAARSRASATPLVLGGKSMGGRIASQVVAGGEGAAGLAFLGYPLHPPGKPERLRDAHLKQIDVPMLFVEGTRDPFCPLPTLERVLAGVAAPARVSVIEGGDHSFKVRSSSGRSTRQAWGEVIEAVDDWVQETIVADR
ncbi:MAG: alpha/beta hydrolase family protein [Actinomycetota bacterium]